MGVLASVPPNDGPSPFATLPPEMVTTVLRQLSTRELALAAQVCKLWGVLANAKELICVPSANAVKSSSRFFPLRAPLKSEFFISDVATAILTHDDKFQYITVISRDGEQIYKRKFWKDYDQFKTIAWLGQNSLATQYDEKTTIRPVIHPGTNKKMKATRRTLEWQEDRVLSSSCTSLGGLAFTNGSSITLYRNADETPIDDVPENREVRKLCVLDHYVVALFRTEVLVEKNKREIQNQLTAYPLNEGFKKLKFCLSKEKHDYQKEERDYKEIASDNSWIIVQEEKQFTLIPLKEKGVQHCIPFSGKLLHFVLKNHLLVAVIEEYREKGDISLLECE